MDLLTITAVIKKAGIHMRAEGVDLPAGVAGIRPMAMQQNRPTNDVDAD